MEYKYIVIVLILVILVILLYKISLIQTPTQNGLSIEDFANTIYPSIPCKKIKLSSTDNNIYLFGILFYDNTGQLINPIRNTFLSSSVYNEYKPNIAATGLYNYITTKKINRNLLSLQTTLTNYSTSDSSININFKDVNDKTIDLPAKFGTWNTNSKLTWVSATADSYSDSNSIGNSYWSITFPTQINLSAIELIGTTSVNTTIKVEITDSADKITFTQILPRTAPRDYYRQIVMPCQFYINIPDSNGNITNNYVNYSSTGSDGYLISKSVSSNSKPDSFFLMQDTGQRLHNSPNRQIIYSSDGQNKFIYATNNYIKAKKQSNTSSFDEDHIQIRLGDFTNTPIDISKSYVFGDYKNYGFLKLHNNLFTGGSTGIPIKLIPFNSTPNIAQATSTTAQAPSTTAQAQSITSRAPSITAQTPGATIQALTTTPFTTTPYNTKYLTNVKNQLDNGYTMLNNNRFTIMDNQLRLDTLNQRINKLLNNINNLNNVSNQENLKKNEITFY